jgi:general secretion pathway protein J
MTGRHARARGFTLLELLVAITLLAVLMAALFGALRLGTRVWEAGEARLDAGARIQVVQDFLRRRLAGTVPLIETAPDPRRAGSLLFVGASDGLRFVSLLPEHLGAGASLMELALRPPARGSGPADLVLRMRPLDLGGGDLGGGGAREPESEERVLIAGVERLEVAYFGVGRPGAAPIWWQEWQGQRSLPALVRLRVDFPRDDGRRWPELIIGLMVDLPPPSQL